MLKQAPVVIQSMAGLVRENIAEINERIANGVRVADIHAEFLSNGMAGKIWSFRKEITRARIRVRGVRVSAATKPALMQTEAVPAVVTSARSTMEGATGELDKYFVRKSIFNKGST